MIRVIFRFILHLLVIMDFTAERSIIIVLVFYVKT